MSKKKKLAGKKTKLAKHSLTKVLTTETSPEPAPPPSRSAGESPDWSLTQAIEALRNRQLELDLTIIQAPGRPRIAPASRADTASYLDLLNDLYGLRNLMMTGQAAVTSLQPAPSPARVPSRSRFRAVMQETRKTLQEIRRIIKVSGS